jgi:hypothetical protein
LNSPLHHSFSLPTSPEIVSTVLIFPLAYMCTQHLHYIHPPTPLYWLFLRQCLMCMSGLAWNVILLFMLPHPTIVWVGGPSNFFPALALKHNWTAVLSFSYVFLMTTTLVKCEVGTHCGHWASFRVCIGYSCIFFEKILKSVPFGYGSDTKGTFFHYLEVLGSQ